MSGRQENKLHRVDSDFMHLILAFLFIYSISYSITNAFFFKFYVFKSYIKGS